MKVGTQGWEGNTSLKQWLKDLCTEPSDVSNDPLLKTDFKQELEKFSLKLQGNGLLYTLQQEDLQRWKLRLLNETLNAMALYNRNQRQGEGS